MEPTVTIEIDTSCTITEIEDCKGYKSLLQAVEKDCTRDRAHDYRAKLKWVVDRATHYAEKTGLAACEILNAWEERRDYWYMNYYQDANQPEITSDRVRVFETVDELLESIGKTGFRCPHCEGVTKNPYECDSKIIVAGKPCDWKVYGLFGHMGRGVFVYVKRQLQGEKLFMPIAWEKTT